MPMSRMEPTCRAKATPRCVCVRVCMCACVCARVCAFVHGWGASFCCAHVQSRLGNAQGHTTWVPTDWNSWPNYNVHGYGVY